MERETLDRREFEAFMKGEALPKRDEAKEALEKADALDSETAR